MNIQIQQLVVDMLMCVMAVATLLGAIAFLKIYTYKSNMKNTNNEQLLHLQNQIELGIRIYFSLRDKIEPTDDEDVRIRAAISQQIWFTRHKNVVVISSTNNDDYDCFNKILSISINLLAKRILTLDRTDNYKLSCAIEKTIVDTAYQIADDITPLIK